MAAGIFRLPRYMTPDADRRPARALEDSPCRLAADALMLKRAFGLRIGELTKLAVDCVHEVPVQGLADSPRPRSAKLADFLLTKHARR